MKRNYILSLLAVAMLMPFSAIKAQYDAGDSTVCYNIMTNNFASANMLNWNDPDPGNWLGVVWNTATPKRIIELSLKSNGTVPTYEGGVGNWTIDHANYYTKHLTWTAAGVDTDLKGDVDFSGLSELVHLKVSRHDSITGIDVSGLANLRYLYAGRNDMLDTLDVSGLPNLYSLHCGSSDLLVSLNASNCPRLYKIKASYSALTHVNINGSDSLAFINFNRNDIDSLDVSSKTELLNLNVHDNDNLVSLVGLQNLSKLFALKIADTQIGGMIDIAWFNTDSLYKFGVGRTGAIDTVANWGLFRTDVEAVNVEQNKLSLSNATQIFNELAPSNSYNGTDQVRYGGDTIYVTGSTSYPGEALIDINGTNVASTFDLFDGTGTQVGVTSATGVFTFPTVADTGAYYVEMNNPGAAPANNPVDLVTDTFWVATCPQLDTTSSIFLTTITIGQTAATYQWLDCDNGNAVIAGATSQSYTATANGNYAVEMTLGGVCVDTSACINIATVGLDESSSNNTVRAYPNPMNEQVTIELEKVVANTQVTIVNVEGKVVYSNIVNTGRISVDGSTWNNGIYIVRITNEEYTKTLKLIK